MLKAEKMVTQMTMLVSNCFAEKRLLMMSPAERATPEITPASIPPSRRPKVSITKTQAVTATRITTIVRMRLFISVTPIS